MRWETGCNEGMQRNAMRRACGPQQQQQPAASWPVLLSAHVQQAAAVFH